MPAPLVSRPICTLSLKSFGSPTTKNAPRIAPVTDERPPMTTMEMTRSDSAAGKSPGAGPGEQPDEQAAGQTGDPTADAERGDLHRGRRDAERRGGPLVVAHGDHRSSEAAALQQARRR